MSRMLSKYINLNAEDRFVKEETIRDAYVWYRESLNPKAPNFISFDNGLHLGIVESQIPDIAKAISSVLTCSLEDAKVANGGYLPPGIAERVQHEIISPFGIASLWGVTGHRFILSRPAGPGMREIVASILVGKSKDTIFFFTGKYNNIKHSEIEQTVDLNQMDELHPGHKWFDRFNFPELKRFKPQFYHQIANFVVQRDTRGKGLARFFLENIVKYYSRDHMQTHNNKIEHSQHLLCGRGFWQIGDPPWLPKMQHLGFYLRGGAESFFIDQDWAPLAPLQIDGKTISNIEYNQSYGLPDKYLDFKPAPSTEHMLERIPEVIRLSQDPRAKLQYFQAMYNFL